MIKIDWVSLVAAALLLVGGGYIAWIIHLNKAMKSQIEDQKIHSEIQRKMSEAEIFSKDQLIKIKTGGKKIEDINLSIGTHKLVF